MNSAYIGKLMELAELDHDVLHLLADSGTVYDEMFRRNFHDQIFSICQSIDVHPFDVKNSFALLKCLQPKNPLYAESGLG